MDRKVGCKQSSGFWTGGGELRDTGSLPPGFGVFRPCLEVNHPAEGRGPGLISLLITGAFTFSQLSFPCYRVYSLCFHPRKKILHIFLVTLRFEQCPQAC
jgi:hypothetical protein